MKGFIKLFALFIYLCLSLFINNGKTLAYETLINDSIYHHHISQQKNQTILTDEKKHIVIFKSQNESEITSSANKNNNYNSKDFDKSDSKFNITNNFLYKDTLHPVCISYGISQNLKHAIYTRAP